MKWVATFGLLSMSPSLWAISNIENERITLPDAGFTGVVKLGLEGKTGNQQKQSYEAGSKIVYRVSDDIFMTLLDTEFGNKNHKKNTDNSFAHLRWTHLLNEHWATELFTQWEQDEFDNLRSRSLVGGGGRYNLFPDAQAYSLALGLGAFHERESLDLISRQEDQQLWRYNSYYAVKYQFNEQLTLINTTYYQPSQENSSDYRMLFDLSLAVKMAKHLSLQAHYKLSYDSMPAQNFAIDPPINNHKTNTEYKTNLSYSF